MSTLLIRDAEVLVTMDGARRELSGGWLLARDGVIEAIGTGEPPAAEESVSAVGCVVTPGLINTHHHLFQTLTKAVPGGQDALLFGWLRTLYPIWAQMGPEEIALSTTLGLSELALAGCTTSSDHLYMFPNGAHLSDSIHAAREVGVRFHATRGSMSIGESKGGLPPDILTEGEDAILRDCADLADRFHDPADGAMTRIGFAPCSPFSVSRELMRDSAVLAREKGVMLHTHLAENDEDIAYSLEKFGVRPGRYAEDLGWVGEDVWHAHCVKLDAEEIALFARTGTGVAHCPCSNCRLGSGVAPVRAMRDAKVKVALGVDGSASSDAGHLVGEARQAMLMQRATLGADAMSAREALEIATLGGAAVLGRRDVGALEVGKQADLVLWDMGGFETAGAWDPVAALVLCGPMRAREVFVGGRAVVREGRMATVEAPSTLSAARRAVEKLANG